MILILLTYKGILCREVLQFCWLRLVTKVCVCLLTSVALADNLASITSDSKAVTWEKSVGLNVSFLFQVTHTVGTEFAKANMFVF